MLIFSVSFHLPPPPLPHRNPHRGDNDRTEPRDQKDPSTPGPSVRGIPEPEQSLTPCDQVSPHPRSPVKGVVRVETGGSTADLGDTQVLWSPLCCHLKRCPRKDHTQGPDRFNLRGPPTVADGGGGRCVGGGRKGDLRDTLGYPTRPPPWMDNLIFH